MKVYKDPELNSACPQLVA